MKARAALILLLTAIAISAPVTSSAATDKPLRLSGVVAESPTPDPACRGLRIPETGTLTGPPFGRAIWTAVECADFTAEPGGIVIRDGHFLLSARAGTVRGTYTAHASYPSSQLHIYAWGPFTITSGTGAYKGVRGGGLLAADAQPAKNIAQFELAGTIRSSR